MEIQADHRPAVETAAAVGTTETAARAAEVPWGGASSGSSSPRPRSPGEGRAGFKEG